MAWNTQKSTGDKLKLAEWNDHITDHGTLSTAITNIKTSSTSYLIYLDGTTIKARNGTTGIIDYSGTSAYTIIQSAINACSNGGKIIIKKGIYSCGANVITLTEGVYLEGESRGWFSDLTSGTVLVCNGVNASNLKDFGVSELTISANTVTTGTGLLMGSTDPNSRPKFIKLMRLKISGFATGILGQNYAPDDTTLNDIYITNCTTAIAGLSSQTKMFGGAITLCTTGINLYHAGTVISNIQCFGTVFSTNNIDITLTGSNNIDACGFYGCWFEAEVTGILYINPSSAFAVPTIIFSGCGNLTPGSSYLMDLRGTNYVYCSIIGGTVSASGTVYVDANTRFEAKNIYGEENITLNGTMASPISYFHEKTVVSPDFAINSTGVKTVNIPHGLRYTPSYSDCSLTICQGTAVDDWGFNMLKITGTDATNVYTKVNVSIASATGGAVAKILLRVGNP